SHDARMAGVSDEAAASPGQGEEHGQNGPPNEETAMKKPSKRDRRKKTSTPVLRLVTWTVAIAAVALVLFAIAQSGGVAFDENDIAVVSFSGLTSGEKRTALQAANRA